MLEIGGWMFRVDGVGVIKTMNAWRYDMGTNHETTR